MSKVTIFPTIKATTNGQHIELINILEWIKEGQWRDQVETVRNIYQEHGRTSKEYKSAKKTLPYFTGSGTFNKRSLDGLIEHSGYVFIDIDNYTGDWEEAKAMLANDPYTFAVFYSVSGDGLCVGIEVNPEYHEQSFKEIEKYYLDTYQINIDFLADVSRARFVSYDDEIVINENSLAFSIDTESTIQTQYNQMELGENGQFLKGDEKYHFDLAIKWVKKTGWDYVDGQRHSFIVRCANLWNEFGITQEKVNELLSDTYPHFLQEPSNAITWTYKNKKENFGIKKRRGRLSNHQVNKDGELDTPQKGKYITKKGEGMDWAFQHIMDIWGDDLYRSEINKMLMYKNEEVDDIFINDLYRSCHSNGINITKDDLRSIIGSSEMPSKHPIQDFIDRNALTTKGNIEKIAKSLNTNTYPEALTVLLFKKWYVGMIGNIFNHHVKSPLMIVLFGGQNNGKSWFFRNLLPIDLINMDFYVENKLDKDIEETMAGKILVMDDEYGGKSKKDSKLLKDIISKNKFSFRRKYGKLPVTLSRIATLCGTTNEPDILVDTTGNRRVIPIEIIERNFDLYDSVCKTQLFLEAYKLYKEGFKYELTKEEIEEMGKYTDKFERETTEAGLIDKYFRPVTEDDCRDISYKGANMEAFEWLTTTEIEIHIKNESGLNRISNIMIGKELRKSDYFQKRIKVKGKVGRYWACRKIGDGSDIEEAPF